MHIWSTSLTFICLLNAVCMIARGRVGVTGWWWYGIWVGSRWWWVVYGHRDISNTSGERFRVRVYVRVLLFFCGCLRVCLWIGTHQMWGRMFWGAMGGTDSDNLMLALSCSCRSPQMVRGGPLILSVCIWYLAWPTEFLCIVSRCLTRGKRFVIAFGAQRAAIKETH